MLRTFLVLMIAAVMSFSIVGCGGGGETPAPEKTPAEESVTPAEGSETQAEEMMEEGEEHPTPMTEGEEHPTPITEEEGTGTEQ